jgi:WxcM-like, C-terminal
MTEANGTFASFSDGRGTLVAIEMPAVDFDVRHAFTVVGVAGGNGRGDHPLTCRELIVLVSGEATVEVGPSRAGPFDRRVLSHPGQSLDVSSGSWLRYTLRDDRSVILVLAAAAYESRAEE